MSTILVLDLESTCDEGDRMPRTQMEIIEIGAVKIDMGSLKVIDEYQSLIKPMRNPKLTDFCINLTTITQDMVNNARLIYEVFPEFESWVNDSPSPKKWGSWGAYDRNQIAQDCKHFGVKSPIKSPYLNLRSIFGDAVVGRKRGLANSLKIAGIESEGTQHRALDDVKNIVQLVQKEPRFSKALITAFNTTNESEYSR